MCRAQDVPFVVAILPALVDTSPSLRNMDDYPFGAEHTLMHEQMTKLGLDWIDLLPDFAGEDSVKLEAHPFDRHFNERGNAIIARALKKYLEPKIANVVMSSSHWPPTGALVRRKRSVSSRRGRHGRVS